MAFEALLDFMTNLRLHNVSIHGKFYQNLMKNECARIFFAKIIVFRTVGRSREFVQ